VLKDNEFTSLIFPEDGKQHVKIDEKLEEVTLPLYGFSDLITIIFELTDPLANISNSDFFTPEGDFVSAITSMSN
jgi:hypothetical protein